MKKKIIGLSGVFIALVLVIVLTIPLMVSMIVTVMFGGNEDNNSEAADYYDGMYVSLLLSDAVEDYRPKVLTQAKKQGMEAYIELFLAVMQQESGGNGNDVFQASESKGLPPNTLSADESIKQGVAYLSAMIRKAGCTSPTDIAHIKLALQGYNFGGGYIDFAIKKDDKWTQNNTFAYAKKQSKGKRNTGKRVEQLGPWHYGDQYYTQHVLRYYSTGLSTIHFYIILKLRKPSSGTKRKFEHHTFLHHSQTDQSDQIYLLSFEHHTFLHHSQTSEEGYYEY